MTLIVVSPLISIRKWCEGPGDIFVYGAISIIKKLQFAHYSKFYISSNRAF